ncbi:MAG TPA: VWA domain-containing protein [Bryobacteraceae bacterium]|nr:VWA domain-containing protein [Bryobacteraceae bacterium]
MRLGIVSASLVFLGVAVAQTETQQASVPETTTREQPATFRTGVNLVMVPVVVRDRQSRAVGGLQQEDFQVFDKGKPQIISRFTVEKSGVVLKTVQPAKTGEKLPDQGVPAGMPERFVAYLFDDLHISFGDLARVRDAATRHIDSLAPTDRAAIYTTSGQVQLDFTDDRAALHETLMRLIPRPMNQRTFHDCPDLSYYMADMVINKNDPVLMPALIAETVICANLQSASGADAMVRGAAQRVFSMGDQQSRIALSVIRDVIRRMSGMPGQRTIIFASPGFYAPEQQQEKTDIMDRAIRYNVTVNSIDARGLYTDPTFDASRPGPINSNIGRIKDQYDRDSMRADADVLAEFAAGTGGAFVENTNDLDGAFKRVATAPEYYYVLGFSPQNLKLDGAFHALKVTLKDPAGLSTQARRGYYAPKHLSDAVETAKEEIREALFSKEELHELPIDLHTQFFKSTNENARVTVLTHVDLRHLRLRKAEGRNRNELTITAALFDRNGNYITGNQKLLEMRLKDETLEQRADTGFTVRSTFDVKPGTYMVRLVVRDAEGQQMSAANGTVDIP